MSEMKSILRIGFLLFFEFSFGQFKTENDTILKYIPDSVLRYIETSIDEDYCIKLITEAENDITQGRLYMPYYFWEWYAFNAWDGEKLLFNDPNSKTLSYLLENKYDLSSTPPYAKSSGPCMLYFTEMIAYDLMMIKAVEQKYGEGFYQSQINYADSLIKNKIGYNRPFPNNLAQADSLVTSLYQECVGEGDHFFVSMRVDSLGQVGYVSFLQSNQWTLTPIDVPDFYIDIIKTITFSPGSFEGKPIEDSYFFIVRSDGRIVRRGSGRRYRR